MKLKHFLIATIALTQTVALTSCLSSGEDDQHSAYGYFTVTGNTTEGYTLYQDGGGTVIPTMSSVSDLTQGKGFQNIERVMLSYTYQDKDISEDGKSVTGAKLTAGESYTPLTPISKEVADSQNILNGDSIFEVANVSHAWAYRGYLNIIYTAYYAWNEKKNGYLYPTVSLVYDTERMTATELNLTLCHNERRAKGAAPAGSMSFTECFRLTPLQFAAAAADTVTCNIGMAGISKPITLKIAREDFVKGNWR